MTVKFTSMCDGQKQEFSPTTITKTLTSRMVHLKTSLEGEKKFLFRTLRPFSLSWVRKSVWEIFTVVLYFSHKSTCLFVFRYCADHIALMEENGRGYNSHQCWLNNDEWYLHNSIN